MYGGTADDYLPEIVISSATVEIYNAFVDLETQWKPHFAGGVVGLDYSAIPFVLDAHGITDKRQAFRDLRAMEAAALVQINSGG